MADRTSRRAAHQALHPVKLADPTTHQHVEKMRQAVTDLQRHPLMESRELGPITLPEGTIVKVRHGLGRALKRWERIDLVVDDAVTSAGTVVRIRKDTAGNLPDDATELWLKAFGWGTDVQVAVKVRVY